MEFHISNNIIFNVEIYKPFLENKKMAQLNKA